MQKSLWIWLLSLVSLGAMQAQDIVGDWNGTLKVGAVDLHLVLHITKDDNGGLKTKMDSLDQGAKGIPVTSKRCRIRS